MHSNECIICGVGFSPKSKFHPNQKCCSQKCRFALNNKNQADYKRSWASNNSDKMIEARQKYANENRDRRVESTEKWRKANMSYYAQYASLRTRHVQQAKPRWLSELEEQQLIFIYDEARKQGKQVDHIIPIKNKRVCGLHVPWNLQLLTKEENVRKSNKFDEDVVAVLN